jgi:hypothetical protein
MALEDLIGASKFIDALDSSNPRIGDNLSQGDDHIRGVKNVLLNSLPNVTGAITSTQTELNLLDGITGMQDVGTADSPTFIDLTAKSLSAKTATGLTLTEDGGALGVFIEDSTGNVGIGTNTPNHRLDIYDAANSDVGVRNAATAQVLVQLVNAIQTYKVINSNTGFFQIEDTTNTNTVLTFYNTPANNLIVGKGSDVGLLTSDPTNTLDVNGTLRVRSLPSTSIGLIQGELYHNTGLVRVVI